MSGQQLGVLATLVSAAVAVVTLALWMRAQGKKQAAADAAERDEIRANAFTAGRDSRNDEVRLLTSQRDDARRDRDLNHAQSEEGWRRYNDLRDRRADP